MIFAPVYTMYQVFSRLDNYNMMIKLKKMACRVVKSSEIEKVLMHRVAINELW
jgi:hypothetical protein